MPPAPSLVEGLEARLGTLREGIVDGPTAEEAVEGAQVCGRGQQAGTLRGMVEEALGQVGRWWGRKGGGRAGRGGRGGGGEGE